MQRLGILFLWTQKIPQHLSDTSWNSRKEKGEWLFSISDIGLPRRISRFADLRLSGKILGSAERAAPTLVTVAGTYCTAPLRINLVFCFAPVRPTVSQENFECLNVLRFLVDPTENLTMLHEYSSMAVAFLEYSTNSYLSLLLKNV